MSAWRFARSILLACALLAVLAAGASAVVPVGPVSTAGPTASETPPGVGGYAYCDDSTAVWTGYDPSTDSFSGWAWYRDGVLIAGETSPTYVVAHADVNTTLTCADQVSWSHGGIQGTTALGLRGPGLAIAPSQLAVNTYPPMIDPTYPYVDDPLTCFSGSWDGYPSTYHYQWTVANQTVGVDSSGYTAVSADAGKLVVCSVVADNDAGASAPVASNPVTVLPLLPPAVVARPSITPANAHEGDLVDCGTGTWSDPNAVLSYVWASGGTTVGTDSQYYTIAHADIGQPLTCAITATTRIPPAATATSDAITPTPPPPPTVVTAPSIFPDPAYAGDQLTCDPGAWSDGAATFSYRWTSGAATVGTDSATYTSVLGDGGKDVVCHVTASTPLGGPSAPADSNAVVPAVPAPASNLALPSIAPDPAYARDLLTCDPGSWSGDGLAYAYRWRAGAADLGTGPTYQTVDGDAATTITCTVTASNIDGPVAATSAGVTVAPLAAPVNTVPPRLAVAVEAGGSVWCDPGTWTGGSITLAYSWKRDDGALAETSDTYVTTPNDAGHRVTCTVTADNPLGSPTSHDSNASAVVAVGAPYPSLPPYLSRSSLAPTDVETCDPGYWSNGPVTFAIAWLRNGAPAGSGPTYLVRAADVGATIACRVTGTALAGGAPLAVDSASITVAAIATPTPVTAPHVSTGLRTPTVGDLAQCLSGDWRGGTPTLTYRWQRDGVDVPDDVSWQVPVLPADAGHVLRCIVTATNAAGHAESASAPTPTVVAMRAPAPPGIPTVSAPRTLEGDVAVCHPPTSDVSPVRITYSWALNGTAIPGEIGTNHRISAAEAGGTLTCTTQATNALGTSAAATSTGVTLAALAAPTAGFVSITLSDQRVAGAQLICESRFGGAPTAYAYVWKKDGTAVGGATRRTLETAPDAGGTYTCEVTATNATGSSAATASAPVTLVALAVPTTSDVPGIDTNAPEPTGTATCNPPAYVGLVQALGVRWLIDGVPVANERQDSYRIAAGDVGKALTCELTAYNGAGPAAPVVSPSVSIVPLVVPVASATPVVYGTPMPTQQLQCAGPAWDGVVDSVTDAWQRDDVAIPGATGRVYTPVAADLGHTVRCVETAHNGAGASLPASSGFVYVAPLTAPEPSTEPSGGYSNPAEIGATVSCGDAIFAPAPTTTANVLLRDDGTVLSTTGTYVPTTVDIGHLLVCRSTGQNAVGHGIALGGWPWVIAPITPTPHGLPMTIAGADDITWHVGESVTCAPPGFLGDASTVTEGWSTGGGAPVAGASHVLAAADLGQPTRCVVSATTHVGAHTGTVAGAPLVTAAATTPYGGTPYLSVDLAWVGDQLACAEGPWRATPTSFARTWARGGAPIAGQAGATYTVVAGDASTGVACSVQGSNALGGGTTSTTRPVWVLPQEPPFQRSPLTATTYENNPYPGAVVHCITGAWGGGGVTFAYAWKRGVTPVPGQSASDYTATTADIGQTVSCAVTATNPRGSLTARSTGIAIIAAPPQTVKPAVIASPSIVGSAVVGSLLTCNRGTWAYVPSSYTIAWKRGTTAIAGASSATYRLTAADGGRPISCSVTATNNVGSTTAASGAAAVSAVVPLNAMLPKVAGAAKVGGTLTCSPGTWVGGASFTYRYQWYRGAARIAKATAAKYRPTKADRKKKVTCQVVAVDSAGASKASASKAVVVK